MILLHFTKYYWLKRSQLKNLIHFHDFTKKKIVNQFQTITNTIDFPNLRRTYNK